MKNRQLSTGIIGAIVLVISMIVFFLATAQRETLEWVCLTLILFSEALFFGGMLYIEHYAEKESGTFLRSGVVTVLALYCIASLGVTFFFLMGIGNTLRPLIIIQLVLLGAALIAVASGLFRQSVRESRKQGIFNPAGQNNRGHPFFG